MPEIGEKFYRSTLVSPDVAPGNDGGGEEYMAKVKTPTSTMESNSLWSLHLQQVGQKPQEI